MVMQNRPPTRRLGKMPVVVSEVGLGCNRIGEDRLPDAEWIRMLHRAADLGVTLYDTAAQYAGGRSEELIGRAFENRDDVVIASKVSPVSGAGERRFPAEAVIAGAERSLRTLRRDHLDIFQTHGSGSLAEMSDPEWAEAMSRLQEQGKVRFRGAAVFDAEGGIHAIRHGLVEVLQITYNLIDTAHADPILPVAEEHGVGLLARMPYQRGILTGKFTSSGADLSDHRARLQGDRFVSDFRAAQAFRVIGEDRPGGLSALAMQFVLAEPRISSVIPGARSIAQLEANLAAAAAPGLTGVEAERIRQVRAG